MAIYTNRKAELVAARAAEVAGYLTVGSKSYLKDQLAGKRNGQEYEFVVPGAGEFKGGIGVQDLSSTNKSNNERKVTLEIYDGAVALDTNAIEKVTDLDWDEEVVQPNTGVLVEGVIEHAISKDIGSASTAFIGQGFAPLSKASAFLKSTNSGKLYGFVDPMLESTLSSNGQMFQPVNAPAMYENGLIGKFNETEFRAQRFIPEVEVSANLASELASATVSNAYDNGDGTITIELNGVSENLPKGFPLMIKDVYATDLVGKKTNVLKAFVAIEDGTSAGQIKAKRVELSNEGNREVSKKDGSNFGSESDWNGSAVVAIPEGLYYMGIVRVDGAYEFDCLDKCDFSNADGLSKTKEGLTVHQNRAVDVIKGINTTRWDIIGAFGVVDARQVSLVYVKA